MIAAYLTQMLFPESDVDIAEVTAVKERTSLIFFEDEAAVPDIVFQSFSETSADAAVKIAGLLINIYLPAYTAVISAFIGDTSEFAGISRCAADHDTVSFRYSAFLDLKYHVNII